MDVGHDGVPDGCNPCVGQLLNDPGFEAGDEGWRGVNHGGRSVVSGVTHGGKKSLRMQVSERWPQAADQDVAVTGGATYEVSVWVRTKNFERDGVELSLFWLWTAGLDRLVDEYVLRTDRLGSPGRAGDWFQLANRYPAPAGAVAVRFQLVTFTDPDDTGVAWFDDAALCEILAND